MEWHLKYRPRLLAIDVDGTLIADDESAHVSHRTKAALQLAADNAIQVILMTGRPPRWIPQVREKLGDFPMFISNGAYFLSPGLHALQEHQEFTDFEILEIISKLDKKDSRYTFAIETAFGFIREPSFPVSWDDGGDEFGFLDRKTIGSPCSKILVRTLGRTLNADFFLNEIRNNLGDSVSITRANTNPPMIEITRPEANKKSCLENFANKNAISRLDTYAIGDGVNDFEMLRWSHYSWAMKSGHQECRTYADYICDGFNDDGAAKVIEFVSQRPFRNSNNEAGNRPQV